MILGVYLSPYFLNIENSRFLIHDNLDSNIVWYKNLANSGQIFNHKGGIIENSHLGFPRDLYPSDLNLNSLLFWTFPAINAYCILLILMHILAFLGMFLLCKDFLIENHKSICIIIALFFSLIPFWPSGALTVAGQPILIWSLFNLGTKKKTTISWTIIFFFPFCSSLFSGNIFFIIISFLIFIIYCIKKTKIDWQVFLAFFIFTLLSIIIEHRIFEQFLFSELKMQRSFSNNYLINFNGLVGISFNQFIKGQYHFFGRTWPLLPLFIIINFIHIKSKNIRLKLITIVFLIFTLSILSTSKDFSFLNKKIPFFQTFNPRFISLNPVLWYIAFALSFHNFHNRKIHIKIVSYVILLIVLIAPFFNLFKNDFQGSDYLENSFYNTYVNTENESHQSFNKYYMAQDFNAVKEIIDNSSIICCVGIPPEISQFNDFKTFGGYHPLYSQKHCNLFNDIFNNFDESCNVRLYVKQKNINKNTNFKKLLSLNVNYIISDQPIANRNIKFKFKTENIWLFDILNSN